ncbi:MAG: sugar phosphate isomerase/epimerase family protein [Armatimonadota bacterium]|nr:sugar phosphate isomerase/epimerase family protein [Armatimonadota bacterium]
MEPSIWTSVLAALPAVDQPAELAAAGFQAVELSCEAVLDPAAHALTRQHAEALRRAADAAGIRMRQVHFPILSFNPRLIRPDAPRADRVSDFAHPDESCREFELAAAEELLSLCPVMGIEVMVVHPGRLRAWDDAAELERVHTLNLAALRRLACAAERYRVRVAVENMGGSPEKMSYGADFNQLIALVDAVNSSAVGICFDTSHANLVRADIPAAIRQIGPRLFATHISDNLGLHDDHLFPYSGRIAWQPVVDALREIEYAGLFNLETPGENRAPLDVVRLKTRHARQLVALMLQP